MQPTQFRCHDDSRFRSKSNILSSLIELTYFIRNIGYVDIQYVFKSILVYDPE